MNQAFQLIGGPAMHDLLARSDNALGKLIDSGRPNSELITDLYWSALSRPPSESELNKAERHIDKSKSHRLALEDIAWALLNAKEFIFRR
jgi:hypothetical protein